MKWQTRGRFPALYGFEYDFLNRLTDANYASLKLFNQIDEPQNTKYDAHITYADLIGNIASIERKGVVLDTTPCAPSYTVDDMTYTYYSGSSRIKDIEDVAEKSGEGFPAYNTGSGDYTYDDNGNMTYDPSRGVHIHYNLLNLPDSLVFDDGRLIRNLYDFNGTKLAQSTYMANGTRVERRDYIDNIELVNLKVQALHHSEGRVVKTDAPGPFVLPDSIDSQTKRYYANHIYIPTVILGNSDVVVEARDSIDIVYPFEVVEPTDSRFEALIEEYPPEPTWQWEYYIKDHLGNIRLTFSDVNNDGLINVSLDHDNEILEEFHYYPFGMKLSGPWLYRKNLGFTNRYNYNGKEEMPYTGYLYYGARVYDPSVGRFGGVDPLASDFLAWSPYSYTFNNPIRFIDPDGRAPEPPEWLKKAGTKLANWAHRMNDRAEKVYNYLGSWAGSGREALANFFDGSGQAIQAGGVNYTNREGAGAMESTVKSESGAESVDITELLIYTDYTKSMKLPEGFSLSPDGIAEAADLISDIVQGVQEMTEGQTESKNETISLTDTTDSSLGTDTIYSQEGIRYKREHKVIDSRCTQTTYTPLDDE